MDYPTKNALQAGKTIEAALAVLNLPFRGSYSNKEVCGILGFNERTFWRLTRKYELDEKGNLRRPDCIKSFLLGNNRRVSYLELVDFIRRNDEHLRNSGRTAGEAGK